MGSSRHITKLVECLPNIPKSLVSINGCGVPTCKLNTSGRDRKIGAGERGPGLHSLVYLRPQRQRTVLFFFYGLSSFEARGDFRLKAQKSSGPSRLFFKDNFFRWGGHTELNEVRVDPTAH